MFPEFPKSPYAESPFLLRCIFQSFSQAFVVPGLSELALLTVITHPVIGVWSHLAYSAKSKVCLNFAGDFCSLCICFSLYFLS